MATDLRRKVATKINTTYVTHSWNQFLLAVIEHHVLQLFLIRITIASTNARLHCLRAMMAGVGLRVLARCWSCE